MVSGALRGEAAGRTGLVRFEEHDGDNTLFAVPTNATEFLDHVQSTICLLLPDHLMHASSKEGRQEKTQSSPRPFEMELAGRQNGVRQQLASNCTVKSVATVALLMRALIFCLLQRRQTSKTERRKRVCNGLTCCGALVASAS